jgi:hypothetical protein
MLFGNEAEASLTSRRSRRSLPGDRRTNEFEDRSDEAVEAYAKKEVECRDMPLIDIVLVGSDSLDTVKLTHANYFDGSAAVSPFLTGV